MGIIVIVGTSVVVQVVRTAQSIRLDVHAQLIVVLVVKVVGHESGPVQAVAHDDIVRCGDDRSRWTGGRRYEI